jgi:hypothetical protein
MEKIFQFMAQEFKIAGVEGLRKIQKDKNGG